MMQGLNPNSPLVREGAYRLDRQVWRKKVDGLIVLEKKHRYTGKVEENGV
jgi:hypothetical protein